MEHWSVGDTQRLRTLLSVGSQPHLRGVNSPLVLWSPHYHCTASSGLLVTWEDRLPSSPRQACARRSNPCQVDPDLSADQLCFPRRRRENEREKEKGRERKRIGRAEERRREGRKREGGQGRGREGDAGRVRRRGMAEEHTHLFAEALVSLSGHSKSGLSPEGCRNKYINT